MQEVGTLSQKCANGGGGGAGEPRLACLCAFSSLSSWVEEGLSAMKGTVAVPGETAEVQVQAGLALLE